MSSTRSIPRLAAGNVRRLGLKDNRLITFTAALIWGAAVPINYARADDWSTYQHDLQRTGRSSASFDPRELHSVWTSPAGFARPIISGDIVYAQRNVNTSPWPSVEYAAFDVDSGQELWSNLVKWTATSSSVLDGLFVTLDYDDHLRVFNATTGSLLTDTGIGTSGQMSATPVLMPGTLPGHVDCYISGRKYDVTASSTTLVWKSATEGSGPVAVGGESLFDDGVDNFLAVRMSDGKANYFYDGPSTGGAAKAPVFDVTRNRLYSAENNATGSLSAWDYTNNGDIQFRWGIQDGPYAFASVSLGPDGDLYFVDASGILRDYTADGVLSRSSTMTFRAGSTPVLQDGYIWIGDASNTYALDLQTLAPVQTLPGVTIDGDTDTTAGVIFDRGFILGSTGGPMYNDGFTVYEVPEPASCCTLLLSLGAFALGHRRRGRS